MVCCARVSRITSRVTLLDVFEDWAKSKGVSSFDWD